jgi:tripartite-type tricarboxylate transporter receptor subunit TctC
MTALRPLQFLAGIALGLCLTAVALAQGFPSKPVHIIVPFTAGGAFDLLARVVGAGEARITLE